MRSAAVHSACPITRPMAKNTARQLVSQPPYAPQCDRSGLVGVVVPPVRLCARTTTAAPLKMILKRMTRYTRRPVALCGAVPQEAPPLGRGGGALSVGKWDGVTFGGRANQLLSVRCPSVQRLCTVPRCDGPCLTSRQPDAVPHSWARARACVAFALHPRCLPHQHFSASSPFLCIC